MTLAHLFLDLNSFFASVEQAENPKLQGKPIAVVPMLTDSTCCLAASYPAKAFGVKTGTSVRDAKKLCPEIKFIQASHKKYINYHNKVIEVVENCAHISQVCSIDELALELIGSERIEANARKIAIKIKTSLYKLISPALTCSIGIAPNRYLAKLASDMQKPDGLTVLHLEDIPKKLFHLKLRDFVGIGPRMELRFKNYGCSTVKSLYGLTLQEMRCVWGGINGEIFWHLIRGANLPEKATRRRTIGHSHVLAPNLRNYNSAWSIVVKLLSKACVRLRNQELYTKELSLDLKFISNIEKEKYWSDSCKFLETQDSLFLVARLHDLWQTVPNRKFLQVGVTLSKLVSKDQHQLSIFENVSNVSLMQTLDRINKKYHNNLIYIGDTAVTKEKIEAKIAFQRIPKNYE